MAVYSYDKINVKVPPHSKSEVIGMLLRDRETRYSIGFVNKILNNNRVEVRMKGKLFVVKTSNVDAHVRQYEKWEPLDYLLDSSREVYNELLEEKAI